MGQIEKKYNCIKPTKKVRKFLLIGWIILG